MENLIIIPARGGSKRIPRKNIKSFLGKPLIAHTIDACLKAQLASKVIVSTDDEEIANISVKFGADIYFRSKNLAKDNVHSVHVVLDYLNYCKERGIIVNRAMMTFATSPLRTHEDIDAAFELLDDTCDSVVSVCSFDKPESSLRRLKNNMIEPVVSGIKYFETQSQDIKYPLFEVNGSIYVSRPRHLVKTKSFHMGRVKPYIMNKSKSIDINNIDDFRLAELIAKGVAE